MDTTVGFIGLGDMGRPMARRLIDGGFDTTLWARRAASLDPFADMVFHAARTPAELAARSDVIGLCVFGDADVREVVLDPERGLVNGLRPGSVVLVHSTVAAETCIDVAERLRAVGCDLLDAPVTGGRAAAEEGRLGVMVGGASETFDRCLPVMEAFGGTIRHLGPVGSGQRAKLINNALSIGNACLASIALETADALDIDAEQLFDVLGSGGANSHMLGVIARLLASEDFTAQFMTTMAKDASLFLETCRTAGVGPNALMQLCEGPIERTVPDLDIVLPTPG